MNRYHAVISKVWVHRTTGRKVSPYGAVPYRSEAEREEWELVEQGWTIFDAHTNTYGMGRPPFATEELAREQARIWNDQYAGRLKATRRMIGEQSK